MNNKRIEQEGYERYKDLKTKIDSKADYFRLMF